MDRSAPVAPTDQDVSTADKSSRKRPRTPGGIIQNAGIQGQVPPYVPKVKSCIECRQQKIKCNVIKEPFAACSNCTRLNKHCEIDQQFKRIPKRDQISALKDQIKVLQQQLNRQSTQPVSSGIGHKPPDISKSQPQPSPAAIGQILDEVSLSAEELACLFEHFFKDYHSLCPLLDPNIGIQEYFSLSPILSWTVVIIAARRYSSNPQLLAKLAAPYQKLLWATIKEMPQKYHTVKALALLCTWPLIKQYAPIKVGGEQKTGTGLGLSEIDPTFMLSGIMIQIALQTGLHRPLHVHDFIKSARFVSQGEIDDRQLTWVMCNIVAQSVAVANGHPSRLVHNWAYGPDTANSNSNSLPVAIEHRLRIERFSEKMTQILYSNSSDIIGFIAEEELLIALRTLMADLHELDAFSTTFSPFNKLYLLAAKMHFHSLAFHLSSTSLFRSTSLSDVYKAATMFIQATLDYDMQSNSIFEYCTDYILKTLISASCILLKILNSSLAANYDTIQGKTLFNTCILAIRSASVKDNDFPERVAKAQTRMWRAAGGGFDTQTNALREKPRSRADPLELRIRSRMCMSHVFDCIWGWRRTIGHQSQALPADDPSTSRSFAETLDTPNHFFLQQGVDSSGLADVDLSNFLDWAADEDLSYFDPVY